MTQYAHRVKSEEPHPLSSFAPPVLPSLHTLDLPRPLFESSKHPDTDLYELLTRTDDESSRIRRSRQCSVSSTSSSCSSNSSIDSSRSASSSAGWRLPSSSARGPLDSYSLVRTSFDKANAFVVMPPQQPYVPNISALSRANASSSPPSQPQPRRNRAILLMGPAMEYVRNPRMRIAKGTRVHPYRVVSRTERRPSTSSEPSSIP